MAFVLTWLYRFITGVIVGSGISSLQSSYYHVKAVWMFMVRMGFPSIQFLLLKEIIFYTTTQNTIFYSNTLIYTYYYVSEWA